MTQVANSDRLYTLTDIRNLYGVPDWFPGEQPAMPAIVAESRIPAVFACGYCHLSNVQIGTVGRPFQYLSDQWSGAPIGIGTPRRITTKT